MPRTQSNEEARQIVLKTYEDYLARIKALGLANEAPFPYGGTMGEEIARIEKHIKHLKSK